MRYIYSILILLIAVLSPLTQWYDGLVFSLVIVLFLQMLNKTGKGIVLRESIGVLYVLTCLVMPYVGYEYYTIRNPLSRLWVTYMVVPREVYFSYALPAIAAFCFAITLPLKGDEDRGIALLSIINRIKSGSGTIFGSGVVIMVISVIASLSTPYLPAELQFFSNLFYYAGFAGFLYVYFSGSKTYRGLTMLGFLLIIFGTALAQGMFTIVAYMGITIFSFFFLGNKTSMFRKLLLFSVAILFFVVLQSTKGAYRRFVWQSNYTDNRALLFTNLFVDNIQKTDLLFEPNNFFSFYRRSNQGFNVAKVVRRVPAAKGFDGGTRLVTVFASAFVPRFLWPDKPEAGGKFNMEYYAGVEIKGWSTNVGPLGEAYGSFGVVGGIFYMFLLGLFIRLCYMIVFKFGVYNPLIICWIPVLFFQITYSAETDTMAILNSVLKTAFFMWILYKIVPQWFFISAQRRKGAINSMPNALGHA